MKNGTKGNKGITLVAVIITIIILMILAGISLNLTLGQNGLFQMALRAKENMELAQVEEQEKLNALYTQLTMEGGYIGGTEGKGSSYDAIQKLIEFKQAIANAIGQAGGNTIGDPTTAETKEFEEGINGILENVTKDATATDKQILQGETAWVKGQLVTGTMPNNQALNPQALNAGESYPIPEGYTSGGIVTTNSLESQTTATATAEDIATGKTAYVNGEKITGTSNLSNSVSITCYLNWFRNAKDSESTYFSGGGNANTTINVTNFSSVTFSNLTVSGSDTTVKANNQAVSNGKTIDLTNTNSLTLNISGGGNLPGHINYNQYAQVTLTLN